MLEIKDIEKLAKLARIQLTDEEKQKLLKEVDPILGYVAQLKEITSKVEGGPKAGDLRNVMREDSNPTESAVNTEALVKEMPASKDNYLKVKKIL